VDRARSGSGPSLIEAKTYRHGGHSRADPAKYRPAEEVKAWLARDPIPTYRERLLADGVEAATLDGIEEAALASVDRATEEAKAGPFPDGAELTTELWADGGSAWRN
jgi:pyruvate dehydrogenase E1 component alpha subunit